MAALALVLLAIIGQRAIQLDQPLVENYVGRQIPTAMVARNLERGSGFLRPQLDTGPFPNYFVVEPPIFAVAALALRNLTGLGLDESGRLVSAFGIALAAWGLFGLVRPRAGGTVALLSVVVLGLLPVTVRYGRAFQGDAMMLGLVIAGMRAWDESERGGAWGWFAAGWTLLAAGLAVKVIAAWVLIPLVLVVLRPPRRWKVLLAATTLLPAMGWYAHAAGIASGTAGSRAAAGTFEQWFQAVLPLNLLRGGTWILLGRFVLYRSFTPLAIAIAIVGVWLEWTSRGGEAGNRGDGLWRTWGMAAVAGLLAVSGKLHHEYYLLVLAPVVAVWVAQGLSRAGRGAGGVLLAGLAVLAMVQVNDTYEVPPEWRGIVRAAVAIGRATEPGQQIVAQEALLYEADRRGARLELTEAGVRRAAAEWGERMPTATVEELVALYGRKGIRYFADLKPPGEENRAALHEALRGRYTVVDDGPELLLLDLSRPRGDEGDVR